MNTHIPKYYWLVVGFIHEKILKEKMSVEVVNFLKNISYVGLGTAIGAIFSFTFNVLSGRLLGPAEYGEFNLVQSVAMFLYIPMLMGAHISLVKYNSEKKEFHRQQKVISMTYLLVFIQIFAVILLYRLFESELISIFSISSTLLLISIIFALLFVFYTLNNQTLRSLHEMKKYSILIPIFSIILLFSFLYFFHINLRSSRSMIFSMFIAYGVTSLITLPFIWKYIKFDFDKKWITKLTRYSYYATMGGVSSILYSNIDRILINRYMQIEYVGIYIAYNYSFTAVTTILIGIIATVFFPYASMCENKKILLKKVNKSVLYITLVGLPISIISGIIILRIYGDKYVFDPKLCLLCGLTSLCMSVDNVYGNLMNSIGLIGIKIVSFAAIVMALVNILLNLLLIPIMGIEGAMIATILSYCIAILIMFSKRKYI